MSPAILYKTWRQIFQSPLRLFGTALFLLVVALVLGKNDIIAKGCSFRRICLA